jgi:hypothetical protein
MKESRIATLWRAERPGVRRLVGAVIVAEVAAEEAAVDEPVVDAPGSVRNAIGID